jgi:ribosomal protein S18 acetylase RimI-like enzyme
MRSLDEKAVPNSGPLPANVLPLRGRETEPAITELLALAQIHRDPLEAASRAPRIAAEYARSPTLKLYGCEDDGRIVVGLIGIEPIDASRAVIRDLAVAPDRRRRGVGRALIDHLRIQLLYTAVEGDTLEPAVEFYRRCDFGVRPDGTMPDGRSRHRFIWRRSAAPD